MLAQILAVAVGFGSFAVYMAAFFFPEVHRKNDFFWSGVGFFYALILWLCAGRITGAVLLGQVASVALLGWFALQTLYLRRAVTPVSQQTPVPPKLQEQASSLFTVQAEEPSVISTPTVESLNQDQDTIPPVAVSSTPESVAVEPSPETIETEPEVGVSSEISEGIEDIPPIAEPEANLVTEIEFEEETVIEKPEPEAQSETEIEFEQETVTEKPEPEATSQTEIEFEDETVTEKLEDEVDEATEEKTETTPQPQDSSTTPSQPKRLSRLFQSITGIFNRRKTPVPPVETLADNQPETFSETSVEEPAFESIVEEPTPDLTSQTEQPEPSVVVEAETIDVKDINSVSNIENPPETEIEEISITVEPETSSVSPFEQMQSTPLEVETIQPQESSEEIVLKSIEVEESSKIESSPETESSPSDENPDLKRPNPPDPKLKEAAQKPSDESSDSDN